MGRPRTPARIRALGHAPLSGRVLDGAPECPEWLDDIAREEWARIVPELVKLRLAVGADTGLLASYCSNYSIWRGATERVQKEGQTVLNARGEIRAHPCVRIAQNAAVEMRKLASEFGFSPAARGKIETPALPTQESDAFDEFVGTEQER